jgi:hypothetical protein
VFGRAKPCGLGWEVENKVCTCLCDHSHASLGCTVDFRDPATGRPVWYSNLKWGRTLDNRRRETVTWLSSAALLGDGSPGLGRGVPSYAAP